MADDSQIYDVVILGIGYQNLICANYLAKAGYKVCVIKISSTMVGAAPDDYFHDTFMSGPVAHIPVAVAAEVYEDLELESYGYMVSPHHGQVFLPGKKIGEYLSLKPNEADNSFDLSHFPLNDQQSFRSLYSDLARFSEMFSQTSDAMPSYTHTGWKDIWALFETAKRLSGSYPELQDLFKNLTKQSLSQFVSERFKSDIVRALVVFQACIGSDVNPQQEGSALLLALQAFAQGSYTLYGSAKQPIRGSLHALQSALSQAAIDRGVKFMMASNVERITADKKKVTGVVTDNGDYTASTIVCDMSVHSLFGPLLDEALLPSHAKARVDLVKKEHSFVRVKAVLKELPDFICLGNDDQSKYLSGEIVIAPGLDYIQTAFDQTRSDGGAQRPAVSMFIPSLQSQELGAEGHHICSLVGQYFDPKLPDNQDNRLAVAKAVIAAVDDLAPNFSDSIEGFCPIMGDALSLSLGALSPDLNLKQPLMTRLLEARFDHQSLLKEAVIEGLHICGFGGEVPAQPELINAGMEIAKRIMKVKHPMPIDA